MQLKSPPTLRTPVNTGLKTVLSVLTLTGCLVIGGAQAADTGPRHHAQGQYDTVTATYVVVEGDDLIAISERFEVPVDTLKTHNKLTSNEVKAGQKLTVAGSGGESTTHKSAAHQAKARKPLANMTCEDFVGLDETFQPKAVYWAVAYGKNGEPDAEAIDLEDVETVIPYIVEECKKAPKESFWQKVKAETKKIESKL